MIKIKSVLFGGLVGVVAAISTACGSVPEPGQTVLKVYKSGDQAGFENATVVNGSYNNSEWNTVFYSISSRTSNYTYTNSMTEGKATDESIKFRTSDSFVVGVNVGISYTITDPKLFLSVQKMEDELLVSGPLYTIIRNEINAIGSSYSLNDLVNIPGNPKIVNTGKSLSDFQKNALDAINKKTQAFGVVVNSVSFVNGFAPPTEISAQILANQKQIIEIQKETSISAAKATQLQNELNTSKAKLELAKVDAQARQVQSVGLTQEYIALKVIEKWDGSTTLVKINSK